MKYSNNSQFLESLQDLVNSQMEKWEYSDYSELDHSVGITYNSEYSKMVMNSELYDILESISRNTNNSENSNIMFITINSEHYELYVKPEYSDILENCLEEELYKL
jgi:hypothetical protein